MSRFWDLGYYDPRARQQGRQTGSGLPPLSFYLILESGEVMSRISIKGVLLGAITDTLGSAIIGILAAILVILMSRHLHVPREIFHRYGILYATLALIGLVFSALGGYIAAFIAKHDELLNGGLSSFLCVLISIVFMDNSIDHDPIIVRLLLLIASPVFAILGGYVCLRRKDGSIYN